MRGIKIFWKVTLSTSSGLPTMPHWCKFCPPQLKTHFSLSLFNLNEITLTAPGSSDIYLTIITLHTLSIFNKTWETIFCSQQQTWLLVPFYLEQINKWKLSTTHFSEGQGTTSEEHIIWFLLTRNARWLMLWHFFTVCVLLFFFSLLQNACLNDNLCHVFVCSQTLWAAAAA